MSYRMIDASRFAQRLVRDGINIKKFLFYFNTLQLGTEIETIIESTSLFTDIEQSTWHRRIMTQTD